MTRATWDRVSPTALITANCRTRSWTPMLKVVKMMKSAARSDMPVAAQACFFVFAAIMPSSIAAWMSRTSVNKTAGLTVAIWGANANGTRPLHAFLQLDADEIDPPGFREIFSAKAIGT